MRTWLITAPERLKLAWRALREAIASTLLRQLDRWLAARGEERTAVLLDFDEIPALYDGPTVYDDLPAFVVGDYPDLFDGPGAIAYADFDVL